MKLRVQEILVQLQPMYTLNRTTDDSLFGGNLGIVLLYHEWYRQSGELAYLEKSRRLLEEVLHRLENGYPGLTGPSLSRGGAGLAMIMSLFEKEGLIAVQSNTARKKLDQYLFESALMQLENDITDCLHGAFGIMHYFTRHEQGEYPGKLVAKACTRVIQDPSGAWFPNAMLRLKGQDEINFSLSHGQSGMLLVLLASMKKCDQANLIRRIVYEGLRFFSKHRLYVDTLNGEHSLYPFSKSINGEEIENRPRLGWCYGDLNAALLFYRAGKILNDPAMTRLGDMAGLHAVSRKDEESTQVTDSHFCHGAAGVAQTYKCLYVETGITAYLEAYQYWIRKTVEWAKRDMENNAFHSKEHSLLDGPVGVSLVLLSFLSERYMEWSRIFFL